MTYEREPTRAVLFNEWDGTWADASRRAVVSNRYRWAPGVVANEDEIYVGMGWGIGPKIDNGLDQIDFSVGVTGRIAFLRNPRALAVEDDTFGTGYDSYDQLKNGLPWDRSYGQWSDFTDYTPPEDGLRFRGRHKVNEKWWRRVNRIRIKVG